MRCLNCGAEIEGKFCQYCGTPFPEQDRQAVRPVKPVYKKWWFWLIIVLAVIIFAAAINGMGDEEEGSSSQPRTSTTLQEEQTQQTSQPGSDTTKKSETTQPGKTTTPKSKTGPYSAELSNGNFTAGIDFPAGTYDLEAVKGGGNVSSDNMFSGGVNLIMGVKADDMYVKSFKNAKFPKGTVLSVKNVTIKISSKKAEIGKMSKRVNTATKSVELSSGNYVAGTDFVAGIYDIKIVSGNGNVSSDNSFQGGINAIMGVNSDEMYQKEYKNVVF